MNKQEYLLACIAEECSEIQKAAIKAMRFGLGEQECPELNRTYNNTEDLRSELTDLDALRELLEDNMILKPPFPPDHEKAVEMKKHKVMATYARHIVPVGKCVDCGTTLRGFDQIPGYSIWECPNCGHPNSIYDK